MGEARKRNPIVDAVYDISIKGRYRRGRARAKRKGLPWTLALADYASLIEKPCHYCGENPIKTPGAYGLDRKDNSLGYVLGNVVPCCWRCNRIRNNLFSEHEMRLIMGIIRLIKEVK